MFMNYRTVRILLACCISICACSTGLTQGVLLVRGTVSTPNEAEKNYANSITRNLDRLLTDLNVAHETVDDEGVIAGVPEKVRVAILGYNPFPPASELKALKSFVARGGKLVVFYGADEGLAALMNVTMGKYLGAEQFGQFGIIRFNKNAPTYMPEAVEQVSNNIRPVYPLEGKAKIVAMWESQLGKPSGQPAWVESANGFWMTHVLLDDGDSWNKRMMLLGVVGACDELVWKPVAARCAQMAVTLGGKYGDYDQTVKRIAAQPAEARDAAMLKALLNRAGDANGEMMKLIEEGKGPEAIRKSRELRNVLAQAYGMVQQGRAGELRGVWDRKGFGLYPGRWDETCRVLQERRMTDVMPHMLSPGVCNYESKFMAKSDVCAQFGDQAAQCVAAAHARGLKVHAWKICWRVDSSPGDFVARMKRNNRLQVSDAGKTLNWLCPTRADNREMEREAVLEVVTKYKVDGVQLDYIRYQDGHACYCDTCRVSFEKQVGRKIENWPEDVRTGDLKKEYTKFRAAQITGFVKELSAAVKAARPEAKISAAVYGKYPLCIDSVGQDWGEWLRRGYVDFVCPMDYTAETDKFAAYVQGQMALEGIREKVFPGIGVTAAESRLDAVQVVDQILTLRKAGAGGFALFELNKVLEKEILPVLSLGVTRE